MIVRRLPSWFVRSSWRAASERAPASVDYGRESIAAAIERGIAYIFTILSFGARTLWYSSCRVSRVRSYRQMVGRSP